MASENSTSWSENTLLNLQHPEVLSREQLIDVLKARCIAEQDIYDLEKYDLVAMFYKHVTPLPQRIHQLRRARRRGENPDQSKDGKNYGLGNLGSSRKRIHSSSEEGSSSCQLATSTKTSKLNTANKTLTRVKIKRKSVTLPDICTKIHAMNVKSDTSSSSDTDLSSSGCMISKPKAVKLIRKSLGLDGVTTSTHMKSTSTMLNGKEQCQESKSNNNIDSSSDDKTMVESRKKFKRVTITWP